MVECKRLQRGRCALGQNETAWWRCFQIHPGVSEMLRNARPAPGPGFSRRVRTGRTGGFFLFQGVWAGGPAPIPQAAGKAKSFQHSGPYTSCKRVLIFPQVENTVEKVKNFSLKAPFRCGIQPFQPTFQPFHRKVPAAVGYDLYFSRWKADYFRARNLARFAENADIPLTNVIYC